MDVTQIADVFTTALMQTEALGNYTVDASSVSFGGKCYLHWKVKTTQNQAINNLMTGKAVHLNVENRHMLSSLCLTKTFESMIS